MTATSGRKRAPKPTVGWREWLALPALTPALIKVKVDTGARTSALHAFDLELDELAPGPTVAHFEVHPLRDVELPAERVSAEVIEFREIRSSDGRVENRPIIRTAVRLGEDEWEIDLSLTNRDQMGFRMLLGRSAVKRRYVVDPGRSYLRSPDNSPDLTDAPDVEKS